MKEQILAMRAEGMSYNQIVAALGCSKGTVSYHCGEGQKAKSLERNRKCKQKLHPYYLKLYRFSETRRLGVVISNEQRKDGRAVLLFKVARFHTVLRQKGKKVMSVPSFTVDDVITKFGETPICALTGRPIDITKSRSYSFDHIVPRTRGGSNDISNMQIVCSVANQAKFNLTNDEFIELCAQVLRHQGFTVNKIAPDGIEPSSPT